ncbi:MAG: flagellar hook basal-body protein [Planctomycetes bacterium]|nr:flagellar hook basal-body protein [Planctomycetota bacterium]
MPYGLYISAEGAQAQSTRLEVLSNNIANASTPGFKRTLAIFQARYAEETQRGQDVPGSRSINDMGGGVIGFETSTDYSTGPLKETGQLNDLAIPGEGFFMVRRGEQDLLTRAGNFRINPEGFLQTPEGDLLLASDTRPMFVNPNGPPYSFNQRGELTQDGVTTQLAIVRPNSLGDLAKMGDNLFRPLAPVEPVPVEDRNVLTGHLELSTVRPAEEMMELIEASRVFEANTNMVRFQDQMMGSLLDRLMKVS